MVSKVYPRDWSNIIILLTDVFLLPCQAMMINHEKRTRKANKLHKKAHFEKDKKYSQQLKSNINKHSKIVSKLQIDFTDILIESEAKVHAATERYQTLKRDYDSVLDSIGIKHRASLRKIQIVHAQQIQKKNEMVKQM